MRSITRIVLAASIVFIAGQVSADEGGVSFWAPGQFSSFAAVPGEPGFAMPFLASLKEYPPSQRVGSFSIDQMMEALERSISNTGAK